MTRPGTWERSWSSAALQLYARYVPFHRGKQRLMEHLTSALGVSLSGERVVKRGGLWWSLDPADYVCQDLFWCGAKDVVQLRVVQDRMPPGGVMFDVGASFGYYSAMIAHALGERCAIHAFEPNPAAFARLTANLALNNLHSVRVHPLGVWDGEGSASVTDVAGNSGAAYLTAGGNIPMIALDEFCRRHAIERLDLIKVDAEGSELRVLRGAAQTLDRLRPAILVELNRSALERAGTSVHNVLGLLAEHRYAVRPVGFRADQIDLHDLGDQCADVLCTPAP